MDIAGNTAAEIDVESLARANEAADADPLQPDVGREVLRAA